MLESKKELIIYFTIVIKQFVYGLHKDLTSSRLAKFLLRHEQIILNTVALFYYLWIMSLQFKQHEIHNNIRYINVVDITATS